MYKWDSKPGRCDQFRMKWRFRCKAEPQARLILRGQEKVEEAAGRLRIFQF